MAVTQLFFNSGNSFAATTYYFGITHNDGGSSQNFHRNPWSVAGTFANLKVVMAAAPGAGKSWTLTLYKNGSSTNVTVTIADTATEAVDSTHTVSVSPGDLLHYVQTSSGSPSSTTATIFIQFTGTNACESGYGYGSVISSTLTGTCCLGLLATYNNSATAVTQINVIPTGGNLTRLDIFFTYGPGTGKSWTITVIKNGVAQDGAGGTVDTRVTINGAATGPATAYSEFTLPLVAGDQVYLAITANNSPGMAAMGASCKFVGSVDKEFIVTNGPYNRSVYSATQYLPFYALNSVGFSSEAAAALALGALGLTLKNFYVAISAAPGAGGSGKGFKYTVRKNSQSPANGAVVTISETNQTGSDVSNQIKYTAWDTIDIMVEPINTPTNQTYQTYASAIASMSNSIPVFDQYYRRMRQ